MEPCKVRLTVDTLPEVAVRAKRELCADVSGAAHEDLGATASRIDRWVLVEYRGLWDRDVLGGSLLSQALKEHLRDQLRKLGHSRLLFIKRPERRSHKRRMLYVGSCRPGDERFYGLEFDNHDDLVGYDFASALLEGSTPGVPVEHPLFVVCTHGKRDRCCAVYGRPLYDALQGELDEDWVWQATHVGGDRFAGNVVVLPGGLYFGRVRPEAAAPLADKYLADEIDLEHYRGRCWYPFPAQAAEHTLRVELGLTGIRELDFAHAERDGDRWQIAFRTRDGAVHERTVVSELGELTYMTCDADRLQRPRTYRALSS